MKNDIAIEFIDVSKSFSTVEVLKNSSFRIGKGDFVTILGPNGSGKSTLFNLICDFEKPTSGKIILDRKKSTISMVFQNYNDSLMPWKNAYDNIILPLDGLQTQLSKVEKKKKVEEVFELMEISLDLFPLLQYPHQMSGGEKQIASIARALIINPDIILFDEPFASLDYYNRINMNNIVRKLWEKTHKTFLFISHDLGEAIFLAQKIYLLSKKPSFIAEEIVITLPEKRESIAILQTNVHFNALKSDILKKFITLVEK